ncbi:STAS domain-containing protein [Amycolatopsis sp. K13G38]|uniref:Anti-sigma factor antagonist n=1 Tax=Amycolatopsis acididurans TaxID=2724524 RepID=A0ABX1J425_9PSEU|nr:STAS domain-containing protein [Amycolatopsis acididurans]NKQ53041.1 STAS domain-containing protein [Amycolatopsis acididurans]
MLQELALSRRTADGETIVYVTGELDAHTALDLAEALGKQLRPGVHDVIVDVGDVTFMSAAGLQALQEAAEAAHATGVRLRVDVGKSQAVRRVLLAAGGEHLLPLTGAARAA